MPGDSLVGRENLDLPDGHPPPVGPGAVLGGAEPAAVPKKRFPGGAGLWGVGDDRVAATGRPRPAGTGRMVNITLMGEGVPSATLCGRDSPRAAIRRRSGADSLPGQSPNGGVSVIIGR